jgi:GT2 family glycosyltransferase
MLEATVLIVTKNRCDELFKAIPSALAARGVAEVIVIDDGSTDGTSARVAEAFPDVRLHRDEVSRGYTIQRNLGVRMAGAPVVVWIDDDAVLDSPATVEQTLLDFDHPRVGAVAIPHVDVGLPDIPRRHAPQGEDIWVTSEFIGTAAAFRRDVYAAVGGLREVFFHQGEERDLCVRILAAGFVVRVGRADPILHFPSSVRDVRRMDLYGRRNTILYAWFNEPLPGMVGRMVEMSAQGLVSGLRVRRPLAALRGLSMGFAGCWTYRAERRPLPPGVIRVFRRLWKRGPLRLSEVEPDLPPMRREPMAAGQAVG